MLININTISNSQTILLRLINNELQRVTSANQYASSIYISNQDQNHEE